MYRILVVMIVITALVKAFVRMKQNQISVRRFMAWTVLWLVALILGMAPNRISSVLAEYFDIGRGADLFFFFGILFLIYLVFNLYTRMDRMQREMTVLVRELALRDLDKT